MLQDKKVQLNLDSNVQHVSQRSANENTVEDGSIFSTQNTQSSENTASLYEVSDEEYLDDSTDASSDYSTVGSFSAQTQGPQNNNEDELLIKQLEAEVSKLESEYNANQEGKGIAGAVGGFFSSCWNAVTGKGFQDSDKVELDNKIALLEAAKSDPAKLSEAYKTIMGTDLTDEVKQSAIEAQNVANNLSTEEKQQVVDSLKQQADSLSQLMKQTQDDQGWFSKTVGGVNNVLGFGTNSNKANAKVEEYIKQIDSLDPNDPDFAAKYQALTGEALSMEGIEELSQGVSKVGNSSAAEAIMDYEETQTSIKEVGSGLVTGLVTAAAVIAAPITGGTSLLLGAAVGGATTVLINGTDTIGTSKKYSLEQAVLDFGGGAINGTITAMTLGSAGLAGKGFSALKGVGKETALNQARQVTSGGIKNATKNAFSGFGKTVLNSTKIAAFSSTSNYLLNTVGTNALYEATGNYTKSETPANVVQNEDGTYSVYYELTDSNTGDVISYEIETVDSLSQDEEGNLVKGNVLSTARSNDFNLGDFAKQTVVSLSTAAIGAGIGKFTGNIVNPYASVLTKSNVVGNIFEMGTDATLSLSADYLIASAQAGEFVNKDEFFSWDRILGEGQNQIRGFLIGIASAKANTMNTASTDALRAGIEGKNSIDTSDIPVKTTIEADSDVSNGESNINAPKATAGDLSAIKIDDTNLPKAQQEVLQMAGRLVLEENNQAKAQELLSAYGMNESEISTFFNQVENAKQESGLTDVELMGRQTATEEMPLQETNDTSANKTIRNGLKPNIQLFAKKGDTNAAEADIKANASDDFNKTIEIKHYSAEQKYKFAADELGVHSSVAERVQNYTDEQFYIYETLCKNELMPIYVMKAIDNGTVRPENVSSIIVAKELLEYEHPTDIIEYGAKYSEQQLYDVENYMHDLGIEFDQACEIVDIAEPKAREYAVELVKSGLKPMYIKNVSENLASEDSFKKYQQIIKDGFSQEYIDKYYEKMDLNSDKYTYAKELRDAGVTDKSIIKYMDYEPEQINRILTCVKDGIDVFVAESAALECNDLQIDAMCRLKKAGFDNYNAEYFARNIKEELDDTQIQNIAYLHENGLLNPVSDIKSCASFSKEQCDYAVKLKQAGISSYESIELVKNNNAQNLENILELAKAGLGEDSGVIGTNVETEEIPLVLKLHKEGFSGANSMILAKYTDSDFIAKMVEFHRMGVNEEFSEVLSTASTRGATINNEILNLYLSNTLSTKMTTADGGSLSRIKKQDNYLDEALNKIFNTGNLGNNTSSKLFTSDITEQEYTEAVQKLLPTLNLALKNPQQYLSDIDVQYTTRVNNKYPELPEEKMTQFKEQVVDFFKDNREALVRASLYLDSDTINQMMDQRTDIFWESLYKLDKLTDDNYKIIKTAILGDTKEQIAPCQKIYKDEEKQARITKKEREGKPLSEQKIKELYEQKYTQLTANDKITLCNLVEIYQNAGIDMSKLTQMVQSGVIDFDAAKSYLKEEIAKKAGIDTDLSNINHGKFNINEKYLHLILTKSEEYGESEHSVRLSNLHDTTGFMARLLITLNRKNGRPSVDTTTKGISPEIDPKTGLYKKLTLDASDKEQQYLVIRESVLQDFSKYIEDESNIYGQTNARTAKAFADNGLSYKNWLKPEIKNSKVNVNGQEMTIKIWDRNPQEDLFVGAKTSCCTSPDRANGAATPVYLLNTSYNVVELYNEAGDVVGMSRVFMSNVDGKPSLIMDNIEFNTNYKENKITTEANTQLRDGFFEYMNEYVQQVTGDPNSKVYFYTGDTHIKQKDDLTISSIKPDFIGDLSQETVYVNAAECSWTDPTKLSEYEPIDFFDVPKNITVAIEPTKNEGMSTKQVSYTPDSDGRVATKSYAYKGKDNSGKDIECSQEIKYNYGKDGKITGANVVLKINGEDFETYNVAGNKAICELSPTQIHQIQQVRKNYAKEINKKLDNDFSSAYEQFIGLFDGVAKDVNLIKKNGGNIYETEGNIMYGRPKTVSSLGDKIVNKIKKGNSIPDINAATKVVEDGIGTRLIVDKVDEESMQVVTDRLCEEIVAGHIKITEINNYRGDGLPPYFSEEQINEIKNAIIKRRNLDKQEGKYDENQKDFRVISGAHKKAVKASGYTALQMNVVYDNGALGEIQIRGREMDQLAEVEHIPYDAKQGKKLKPKYDSAVQKIMALGDEDYAKYQKYWQEMYEYAVKKERGIPCTKPVLPNGIPEEISYEGLKKIK